MNIKKYLKSLFILAIANVYGVKKKGYTIEEYAISSSLTEKKSEQTQEYIEKINILEEALK